MTITAIPTKTDGDLGRVKADDPAVPLTSLDYQVPAAEYERIKSALIAVIEEAGLTDGSTVGSLRAAINALPALASSTPADVAAAGAVGVGGTVARADHVHAHGAQAADATMHAAATDTAAGFVELATVAECITGTDTARAVTPAGVSALHAYQRTAGTAAAPVTGAFALASYPSGSVVCVSTSGGVATGTLPTPAAGLHYTVKDIGGVLSTNALTIARTGGEKIEGLASDYDFGADYGALHVVCDGTDWWVL